MVQGPTTNSHHGMSLTKIQEFGGYLPGSGNKDQTNSLITIIPNNTNLSIQVSQHKPPRKSRFYMDFPPKGEQMNCWEGNCGITVSMREGY